MPRKLTLSISDEVYEALHRLVGQGRIGEFIEDAVRPRLLGLASVTPAAGRGVVRHQGRTRTDAELRDGAKAAARARWLARSERR